MKISRLLTSCSAVALLFASLPGNADFSGYLSFISQFSDNAEREPDGDLSEWQDKYVLGLDGDYENDLITLEAGYTASMHRYEKDSQPRRELLEGNSLLRLGKDHDRFDVQFIHSRRSVMREPDSVDLLSNTDEREIIAVVPTLRAALTSVDSLLLRGSYAQIDYRFNELKNSEAKGAALIWQRRLTAVDTFEVSVQRTEIEFESVPGADYEYTSILMAYAASLRQLSYKVSGGYNRSSRDNGSEYSGPALSAEASYTTGLNTFRILADQRITDTSRGDGNREELSIDFGSRTSGGVGIDQIELRSLEVRWDNQALCERCDFYLSLRAREKDYFILEEDNVEVGYGAGLSYRLSPAARISLTASRRDQQFKHDVQRNEYTLDTVRAGYYYRFANNINVGVFGEQRERKTEDGLTDYQEALAGLSISYHF